MQRCSPGIEDGEAGALSLPLALSVALEVFHKTLGFCRRQFEDASSKLLEPQNSKNFKPLDPLQLINTMIQARSNFVLKWHQDFCTACYFKEAIASHL